MANHVRQQCRDAIITAVTGLATSGANVLTNVVYDIERVTVPAVGVAEGAETRGPSTMPAPRVFECECEFDVAAYAENNSDCEAALDTMATEIEKALAMPIVGPWKMLTQIASGVQLSGAAQKVRGKRVLRYRAIYRIRENAPDVAL